MSVSEQRFKSFMVCPRNCAQSNYYRHCELTAGTRIKYSDYRRDSRA